MMMISNRPATLYSLEATAERARAKRAKLDALGYTREPFSCSSCSEQVTYYFVGETVRPVALHLLGEQCRKSKTGFHTSK